MTDHKDPPIEPKDYINGLTVVDIGDVRVARGMSRRSYSSCKHSQLVYDQRERRIWCKDCERDIEGFDAFVILAEQSFFALSEHQRREKRLAEAEAFQLRSIAAKEIDRIWRKRNMVPACPHCRMGLLPEYFTKGVSQLGRDYAIAQIKARKEKA
jgi:hypothetical protein